MLSAVDANTAWVAMYKATGSSAQGVYKTTNGGATWTHQPSALFTNSASFPDWIYFWDANNGTVLGDPISGTFEIYTTTDGGANWIQVPAANIPVAVSGEYGYTSNVCVYGDNIWFGTNKGHIYASTDKGIHWTATIPPNMTGKNTFPAFQSATTGLCMKYISSADTLLLLDKSTDGGVSFTVLPYTSSPFNGDIKYVPGTTSTYFSGGVDFTNQANRLGDTYSFDGGTSWIIDPNMYGTQVTTSQWLNDSTGWIGGFSTDATDGINKFNSVLAPPAANFYSEDTIITYGGTAHFSNLSLGKPTTFNWTFTGGTPASSTLKNPPAILYVSPGDYDVKLTVGSDFGTNTLTKSGYIHVWMVGVNDHSKATISMYPNPVADYININSTVNVKEVQVINLIGQVVLSQSFDSKKITMNTTSLKTGVYNLQVKLEDGVVNKKIVVN
jgi:PKD repeat protein